MNPYTDSLLVPDIPHKVELKGYQSPLFRRDIAENQPRETQNATKMSYPKCYKDVLSYSRVSLCHKEILNKINRGQKALIDANHGLNWLDLMDPDILGIGLSIFVETKLSSKEVFIKRERVKEAIEELRNGEKVGEIKRRARELGELANKAVEEGGSSHSNITKFIQDVIMHVLKKE
ncbi:hypothetical protein POM88_002968 [Heracleum sosnowskyi]|uniref:Uncharacterized protein n=1 Tax=Heracleum sosnowskyi TaxID=360622 RepID=A0AAD8JHQ8_9APIA|nr:hypothetical protein POM88_002968 [Heracleum sosnowskyi]